MASLRFARTFCACVLLAAPFGLVAVRAQALVEPVCQAAVTALLHVTASLKLAADPEPEVEAAAVIETDPIIFAAATGKGPVKRSAPPQVPAKPSAIFVSQATVLALVQSAARPRGSFVPQTPQHPAGLRLSGVAGLGIGVQEGDILIEALGVTPRSPGQVIGAIIEARAKASRYLSGTLWRRGQTFAITVEQPYVQPKASRAGQASATP